MSRDFIYLYLLSNFLIIMAYNKIHSICFSATGTTSKIVSAICEGVGIAKIETYDLLKKRLPDMVVPDNEIVVFGVPVYSGRVPEIVSDLLKNIKGNQTPAIIVCVYGNRDFDDALIELRDIVEHNGFIAISAGAFIAQHSIFPQVGKGRPDMDDLNAAMDFGKKSINVLRDKDDVLTSGEIAVKGNFPYREVKPVPLTPKTNKHCNACDSCAKECPVGAIDLNNPKKTDKKLCISCAHCISICPRRAKFFGGILYWLASKKFVPKYATRRNPYMIYKVY